jgi:hypothetical protein
MGVLTIGGDGRMWPDLQVNRQRVFAVWLSSRRREQLQAQGGGGGARLQQGRRAKE